VLLLVSAKDKIPIEDSFQCILAFRRVFTHPFVIFGDRGLILLKYRSDLTYN